MICDPQHDSSARELDSGSSTKQFAPPPQPASSVSRYTIIVTMSALMALLALALQFTLWVTPAAAANKYFNATTTAAKNGKSIIQCWQLLDPITVSSQPGTQGSLAAFLGDTANLTYSVIPANTNGGPHTAPAPQ